MTGLPKGVSWLVGVALVATLTAGCSRHQSGGAVEQGVPASAAMTAAAAAAAPATQTAGAARDPASPGPVSTIATAAAAPAATAAATATATPSVAAAQQSADLAAVQRELQGVDAGTAQTDKDLAAGDSARAQNDNS